MKKVLFVIGSLRKQSFNRQVSEYVKDLDSALATGERLKSQNWIIPVYHLSIKTLSFQRLIFWHVYVKRCLPLIFSGYSHQNIISAILQ